MKRGEARFFVALVVGVTVALALIIRPFSARSCGRSSPR
jgi:hypothetical protein